VPDISQGSVTTHYVWWDYWVQEWKKCEIDWHFVLLQARI